MMDYDAMDRHATRMGNLAVWSQDQVYPPTILEVCQRAGWDAPVSHDDLCEFFASCDRWNVRHNMADEPICKRLLAEIDSANR